jgi:hypothetical protein
MKGIGFKTMWGDKEVIVNISEVNGNGGVYHVYFNSYYEGSIMRLNDQWVGHLPPHSCLGSDEVMVIGELIETKL